MRYEIFEIIKKYTELIMEQGFIKHSKELAERIISGIQKKYKDREEKIVESIINEVGDFSHKGASYEIATKSIFIHGVKSQVTFKYYENITQRELGDIIFLMSLIHKGKVIFEKMTINQVKKTKKNKKSISLEIGNESSKEQLYLLSRFPVFKGAKGSLIPAKEYASKNLSGCLGSHGLIYSPGDFFFISSKKLEAALLGKSSIKLDDLVKTVSFEGSEDAIYPFLLLIFEDVIYPLLILIPNGVFPPWNIPILGNAYIAHNTYDFVSKYLSGNIGELIFSFSEYLLHNKNALFLLQDMLSKIKAKAKKEGNKEILQFLKRFEEECYIPQNGNSNYDIEPEEFSDNDGGLGIIYTTLTLSE